MVDMAEVDVEEAAVTRADGEAAMTGNAGEEVRGWAPRRRTRSFVR